MSLRPAVLSAILLSGCATTSGLVSLPNGYQASLPVADVVLFNAAAAEGTELVPIETGFFRVEYVLRGKHYLYTAKPGVLNSLCTRIDTNGDHTLSLEEYAAFEEAQDTIWKAQYQR